MSFAARLAAFLPLAVHGHRIQGHEPPAALLDASEAVHPRTVVAPLVAAAAASALTPRARKPGRRGLAAAAPGLDGFPGSGFPFEGGPMLGAEDWRTPIGVFTQFFPPIEPEDEPQPQALGPPGLGSFVSPDLVPVEARNLLEEREETILLPSEWAEKLEPGSVEFCSGEYEEGVSLVGSGIWRSTNRVGVAIEVWRTQDPATERNRLMSKLLARTGFVPRVLERRLYPESTWVLAEAAGDRSLDMLIADCERARASPSKPLVPLEKSVPLMIDVLRGVAEMEKLDVVHGDLTERNIHLLNDDRHTMIVDLRRACLAHWEDDQVSCFGLSDSVRISARRHAPEMVEGRPNHVSNNVWQLGLVFSRMLLGGDLPTQAGTEGFHEGTLAGRKMIRSHIRKEFSVRAVPEFQRLQAAGYGDVLDIVAGMLEVEPEKRSTAKAALKRAVDIARARGIYVHMPRLALLPHEEVEASK